MHVTERVAQQSYLVVMFDIGQCCIEIPFGYLVGTLCQRMQRTCGTTDGIATNEIDGYQGEEEDEG